MGPRWLTVLGCVFFLATLGHPAAVPTDETLIVTKTDSGESTPSPPSETTSQAEPAGFPTSEATTEPPMSPIKLTEMDVRSEISMRYAHTAVVTRVRNPAPRAQEATFRVLLPENAFISGFTMILDGKPYKAYVKEKEEAKQIYNDAVSHGYGAAHVAAKARDSNHFTVSVNVEPNTTAVFNLTYEELLVRRSKVYNHAINLHPGAQVPKLTVTVHIKEVQKISALRVPEIRTGNEIDATEEDAQNSNAVIKRSHDDREATITFKPDIDEQLRLMEVYAVKTKESQAHQRHNWYESQPKVEPEGMLGQFVVQYDIDRPENGEILVNDGYFVHFFAPSTLPSLSKHVVFVLDTSGSMMDRKIDQLRDAMRTILTELNKGDYFSIVEFNTNVKVHDLKEADESSRKSGDGYSFNFDYEKPTPLVPPYPATPDNVEKAKVIVSRMSAMGGTNIATALNVAIDLIQKGIGWTQSVNSSAPEDNKPLARALSVDDKPSGNITETVQTTVTSDINENVKDKKHLEPIIIFLTDGDPTVGETNPTRIINRLSEKNYGEKMASIFSLAFGEDADRKFLRKLSLRNEGFMRHIYEAADAALQLRDFYRQVSSPLLADVKFVYPPDQVKEGSLTKHKFRTFYGGSEVVVAGRVADASTELSPHIYGICGVDDSFTRKSYEIFPRVPVSREPGDYLPLERLWAYLTVKQLLDERDAADLSEEDKKKEDSPEKKALNIALKYEFVTPLTSLVVVKPNATKAVDAESVDQDSPPPPVYSAGGFSMSQYPVLALYASPARPQFAYTAFSSAVGHVPPQQDLIPESDVAEYAVDEEYDGDGISNYALLPSATFQPQLSTTPATTPTPAPVDPLETLHLREYSWIQPGVYFSDSQPGVLVVTNTTIDLKLTRDEAPREPGGDAECARATDDAAGVCVYLTRCNAAKNITFADYGKIYCVVNNVYAGVCCPRTEVDVVPTSH